MLHPQTAVLPSTKGGIGVFATSQIPAGTVVWAPCRSCPRHDPQSMLRMMPEQRAWIVEFGYGLADQGMIVACRNAHLLNHSCDASALDQGLDFGVAVRDIAAGEEIDIDYRTFVNDPDFIFSCRCQSPFCVGDVTPDQGLDFDLIAVWRARLEPVLPLIAAVPQPCHAELSAISRIYRTLSSDYRRFRWQNKVSVRRPGFLVDLLANASAAPRSRRAVNNEIDRPA